MRLRSAVTRLHRWLGLVTAAFLLLAGLTGALLAWYEELDAVLAPQLLTAPAPGEGTRTLDPLVLRERVAQAYPGRHVNHVPLGQPPGRAAVFFAVPHPQDAAMRGQPVLQILVHPYTGKVLGDRVLGEAALGAKYVMPFVYRLHHSLALELAGTLALGAVAVLWTLDCFFGLWLTLPAVARPSGGLRPAVKPGPPARSWLRRWRPSWVVRWRAGSYKLVYDLHRAAGLWIWALLFVFAWSSVSFNLSPAYEAVMARAGFSFQPTTRDLPVVAQPRAEPALAWDAALLTGRRLMDGLAREHGFTVLREDLLFHDPRRSIYTYHVRSSLDVRERAGRTVVAFDADTGEQRHAWLPTGRASGDTVTSWIEGLHMAALWGRTFQALVAVCGLLVVLLSVTGVLVWHRKAAARRQAKAVR